MNAKANFSGSHRVSKFSCYLLVAQLIQSLRAGVNEQSLQKFDILVQLSLQFSAKMIRNNCKSETPLVKPNLLLCYPTL